MFEISSLFGKLLNYKDSFNECYGQIILNKNMLNNFNNYKLLKVYLTYMMNDFNVNMQFYGVHIFNVLNINDFVVNIMNLINYLIQKENMQNINNLKINNLSFIMFKLK